MWLKFFETWPLVADPLGVDKPIPLYIFSCFLVWMTYIPFFSFSFVDVLGYASICGKLLVKQLLIARMADLDEEAIAALRKKRQFKKFTFRGIELDKLLDLSHEELLNYVHSRARRRMQRGLKRKPMALIKKLRKAKAGL